MSAQTVRASRRKHHVIYKTTCLATGRYYVGMHSTDDLNDDYLGSSVRLIRSVKKYGRENHVRQILEEAPTREAASDREKELITAEMRADPLCLNCGPGGLGSVDRPTVKEETRSKITASNLKRWEREKANRIIENSAALFSMTREEIVGALVSPSGGLNKNATRNLKTRKIVSRSREADVARKWNFISTTIQNTNFPEAELVELINAYVHQLESRPLCKCGKPLTFFRFGQPYATYCGARCQMLGSKRRKS